MELFSHNRTCFSLNKKKALYSHTLLECGDLLYVHIAAAPLKP